MRELNQSEIQQVNGGFFVAAVWLVKGAVYAYRASSAVRFVSHSAAGGATWDLIKDIATDDE